MCLCMFVYLCVYLFIYYLFVCVYLIYVLKYIDIIMFLYIIIYMYSKISMRSCYSYISQIKKPKIFGPTKKSVKNRKNLKIALNFGFSARTAERTAVGQMCLR